MAFFDPLLLLQAAQCIFMSLPCIGLYVLSRHRPTEEKVNPVRLLKEFAAIFAFVLLCIFFTIESQPTLIILASTNTVLRIMEVLRYIYLVRSGPAGSWPSKYMRPTLLTGQDDSLYES